MKNPKIPERFESKLHEANCPIIRSQDQNCHDFRISETVEILSDFFGYYAFDSLFGMT